MLFEVEFLKNDIIESMFYVTVMVIKVSDFLNVLL